MYEDDVILIKTDGDVLRTSLYHWNLSNSSVGIWIYRGEIMTQNLLRVSSSVKYCSNVCEISPIKCSPLNHSIALCVKYDYKNFYNQPHAVYEAIVPKGGYCIYSRLTPQYDGNMKFDEWMTILDSISVYGLHPNGDKNKSLSVRTYFQGRMTRAWNCISEIENTIDVPFIVSEYNTSSVECLAVATGAKLGILSNWFFEFDPFVKKYFFTRSNTANAGNWAHQENIPFFWGSNVSTCEPCAIYFDRDNKNSMALELHGDHGCVSIVDTLKNGMRLLDQLVFLGYDIFVDEDQAVSVFLFTSQFEELAVKMCSIMRESGLDFYTHVDA